MNCSSLRRLTQVSSLTVDIETACCMLRKGKGRHRLPALVERPRPSTREHREPRPGPTSIPQPQGKNQLQYSPVQTVREVSSSEVLPEQIWRPWLPVQSTSVTGRQMGDPPMSPKTTFLPINPPTKPSPLSTVSTTTMPPPRLPTLKIRFTTMTPYRKVSLSTTPRRPTPLPAIPSANSGFKPYQKMADDHWIVRPLKSRLQLIRKRSTDSQLDSQLEKPPMEKPPMME